MVELCLDLNVVEQNIRTISGVVAALGKQWRPHVKAHCQPKIAKLQIEAGAIGVTTSRVDEVRAMAAAGVPSILFAHIAVRESDRRQLAEAARQTNLILCVDHYAQAELYSETARSHRVQFSVLIDVDIGMERTGCRPGADATQLAVAAAKLPGLQVAGVFGYEGHLLTRSDEKKKQAAIHEAMNILLQTQRSIQSHGMECDIVSAGASGSLETTGTHEAVTELQAGGGIFGDPFYSKKCGLKGVEPALTIQADVISRPCLSRAVVNAGRKAINPFVHSPEITGIRGADIVQMSAEHTVLQLSSESLDLRIGDHVRLIVGYSDHTILMHRTIEVFRGERHIESWPVVR